MSKYHYNDFNDCLRVHCPKCNKPTTIFEVSKISGSNMRRCPNCGTDFIVEIKGRFEFCFEKAEISEVKTDEEI